MLFHRMDDHLPWQGEKSFLKTPAKGERIFHQEVDLVEKFLILQNFSGNLGSFPNHPLFYSFLPLGRINNDRSLAHLLQIGFKIRHRNGIRMHEPMTIRGISTPDISHFERDTLSPKEAEYPVNGPGEPDRHISPSHRLLKGNGKNGFRKNVRKDFKGRPSGLSSNGTDIFSLFCLNHLERFNGNRLTFCKTDRRLCGLATGIEGSRFRRPYLLYLFISLFL